MPAPTDANPQSPATFGLGHLRPRFRAATAAGVACSCSRSCSPPWPSWSLCRTYRGVTVESTSGTGWSALLVLAAGMDPYTFRSSRGCQKPFRPGPLRRCSPRDHCPDRPLPVSGDHLAATRNHPAGSLRIGVECPHRDCRGTCPNHPPVGGELGSLCSRRHSSPLARPGECTPSGAKCMSCTRFPSS